jgi:hypothetical protein
VARERSGPQWRPDVIKRFGLFWYDFIVGDDWRVAVGVVAMLTLTYLLSHAGVPMWWFVPLAVLAIAVFSIRRAARPPQHDAGKTSGDG